MARSADLAFTFDPGPVLKGVGDINKALTGMTHQLGKGAANMTKAVRQGAVRAAAIVGGAVLAFKGMVAAFQKGIPELGESINIAKDIFIRNFLWPLRKELMPLLQRMLDWVREHRGLFIKWGQAVANVFRVLVNVARKVIQWGREILQSIGAVFQRFFGDQVSSWEEAWNLLTAKVAIGAIFIGNLLDNIVSGIAQFVRLIGPSVIMAIRELVELFANLVIHSGLLAEAWRGIQSVIRLIVGVVANFLEGFNTQSLAIGRNLTTVLRNIRRIVDAWMNPTESGNSIFTLAERLGELIGTILEELTAVIGGFAKGLAVGLRNVMDPMNAIVESFQNIWNLVFGGEGLESFFANLGLYLSENIMTTLQAVEFILNGIERAIAAIKEFFTEQWPDVAERMGLNSEAGRGLLDAVRQAVTLPTRALLNPFGAIKEAAGVVGGIFPGRRADDALITKRGEVIQFNPMDNILAFQGAPPVGGNVSVGGVSVTVNVATGADPAEIANETGRAISTMLSDVLARDRERRGR